MFAFVQVGLQGPECDEQSAVQSLGSAASEQLQRKVLRELAHVWERHGG